MLKHLKPTWTGSTLISLSLALISTGCTIPLPAAGPKTASVPNPVVSSPLPVRSPLPSTPSGNRPDPYPQAIENASTAFTVSQQAQSQDDWRLVVGRWQRAIALMSTVPKGSPHYATAQSKLQEYRRNLAFAQQQANRSVPIASRRVIERSQPAAASNAPPAAPAAPVAPVPQGEANIVRVPIVRRAGGTPVINVTFNGSAQFEMIVDTGASGTLITQRMANALGVVPVGATSVNTASARNVSFPLGYVNSIQVQDLVARRVQVAIAGPELSLGLLGHDFFGNYDVTIRQDEVEFRLR